MTREDVFTAIAEVVSDSSTVGDLVSFIVDKEN